MGKFPVTFAEYAKNPVTAISFISLFAMGYLYLDARTTHQETLMACQDREKIQNERIAKLESDIEKLQGKFIELATELR
tara:strand:- start:34 stop:270 length:237 start_codon:yes stop_codon:yes gene_type:complete